MGVAEVSRCECLMYVSVAQTCVLIYVQSFLLVREALMFVLEVGDILAD